MNKKKIHIDSIDIVNRGTVDNQWKNETCETCNFVSDWFDNSEDDSEV